MSELHITAVPDFPLVEPGDNLAELILAALQRAGLALDAGDLLVLAQKIVSKAEDRYVFLNDVVPGDEAVAIAGRVDKDPRLAELILRESVEVVRTAPGVIIVAHRNGYVHANAGIDKSNITSDGANPRVLLLPEDPDASAARLREDIRERTGIPVNIIINDSAGRAWRNGTAGMAIGTAGFEALENRIGDRDMFGRVLEVTEVAVADELAAAASYLMGAGAEGLPVVLIRGTRLKPATAGSRRLIRDQAMDLFR